jgi:hypothetical protein
MGRFSIVGTCLYHAYFDSSRVVLGRQGGPRRPYSPHHARRRHHQHLRIRKPRRFQAETVRAGAAGERSGGTARTVALAPAIEPGLDRLYVSGDCNATCQRMAYLIVTSKVTSPMQSLPQGNIADLHYSNHLVDQSTDDFLISFTGVAVYSHDTHPKLRSNTCTS